jgi:transposase
MAKELVTDELWETIEALLPPNRQNPKVEDRASTTGQNSHGHRVRAKERYPLGDAAPRDGLRLGDDLLETPEGVARGRGVGEALPHLARPPRRGRPDRLGACLTRFGEHPCQKGGTKTGANPTDKEKKGTKRHLVSDRKGIPLSVIITAANVHDSMVFEELIDAIEPIKRPGRGRPRKRPEKLHADKAYDDNKCKEVLRKRGIKSRIARKGIDSSEKLGRHRWVVEERTLAWLSKYRRLTIRYERRDDIHEAFLHLGCSLICFNYLS